MTNKDAEAKQPPEGYMSVEELAKRHNVAVSTLANKRSSGDCPEYGYINNKVYYRTESVTAYESLKKIIPMVSE